MGYPRVTDYTGGLAEWQEEGKALESSGDVLHPAPPRHRGLLMRGIDALEAASPAQLAFLGAALVLVSALLFQLCWMVSAGDIRVAGDEQAPSFLTALYLSLVTVTTLGYGDVTPHGAARFVAVFEAMAGLLLFGALISKFLSRRQERLVQEIHRLAYQDRLGRLQTNLHMVIRELGSLEDALDGAHNPSERLRARMESAVLVFATEVRSVHDLLYRPPRRPTMDVFEGVLAGLAAALDSARFIARCEQAREASGALDSALGRSAELAAEICSDCIPGGYAEELSPWLDRIQERAQDLERRAS